MGIWKDSIDPYMATENQQRHAAQTSSEAFESIAFLSGADKINTDKCLMTLKMTK
jgi:hypothetical protein